MNINEVQKHFGTLAKVCKSLNITVQNVTLWRSQGYIPLLQQYRIAELTGGELMPDEQDPKEVNKQLKKIRMMNDNKKESSVISV